MRPEGTEEPRGPLGTREGYEQSNRQPRRRGRGASRRGRSGHRRAHDKSARRGGLPLTHHRRSRSDRGCDRAIRPKLRDPRRPVGSHRPLAVVGRRGRHPPVPSGSPGPNVLRRRGRARRRASRHLTPQPRSGFRGRRAEAVRDRGILRDASKSDRGAARER